MDNNRRVLEIEDIENVIEIFGNKFELDLNENYIRRLRNIKIENINDDDVFTKLKELLNLILNDNEAYNKIADSYKRAKNKEFGLQAFIRVFEFIFNEYIKIFNNANFNNNMLNSSAMNRDQRRNNNYRRNSRNFRRY